MTFIDLHILQTVPPSNLNRDDTGSPKTAVFGGVRRARVSSQAWKRAARTYFNAHLDKADIGYRTKRIVDLIAAEIARSGLDQATAERLATDTVGALGITVKAPKPTRKSGKGDTAPAQAPQSDYLVFVSAGQVANLADVAVRAHHEGRPLKKSDVTAVFSADQSIDVALFGRMVADDAALNVDAAVQVAHAISVHGVGTEFDYFTAVDDLQAADNQTGAGMIGTVEFNSSTLYRYATLNLDLLRQNLGHVDAAARAATTFVDAFVRSMPSGKQNTFANRTLPDAVVTVVRDDQPVNLAGAFEEAITSGDGRSAVARASSALSAFNDQIGSAYGPPVGSWVVGTTLATDHLKSFGDPIALSRLIEEVDSVVKQSLGSLS